ncbi:TPA: rod shape-determining protein MreD [Streptococcus suis]
MNKKLVTFLMLLLLFFSFILDGQISTLVTNWSIGLFAFSSFTLFMLAIFFVNLVSLRISLIFFSLLGFFYDVSYFGLIGIGTTIFPIVIFSMYFFFQGIKRNLFVDLIILIISIFQFELISFLFARIFHMTNLSFFIFVFNKLLPTMLFNFLLFIILYPMLKSFFEITNKT